MTGKTVTKHKLTFDPKVTQDYFNVTVNAETQAIEVIGIYLWGRGPLSDEEVVEAILGDKYTVASMRGGHGGYDLYLKPKEAT